MAKPDIPLLVPCPFATIIHRQIIECHCPLVPKIAEIMAEFEFHHHWEPGHAAEVLTYASPDKKREALLVLAQLLGMDTLNCPQLNVISNPLVQ